MALQNFAARFACRAMVLWNELKWPSPIDRHQQEPYSDSVLCVAHSLLLNAKIHGKVSVNLRQSRKLGIIRLQHKLHRKTSESSKEEEHNIKDYYIYDVAILLPSNVDELLLVTIAALPYIFTPHFFKRSDPLSFCWLLTPKNAV